ncbi:hypothetical protein B296_00016411 [Ensete ventricosum]|uniref:Uncharacterized protein n=1 Tax=Ensete ventricosum TaxID=4639 RepID=A0A427ALN6_ENSVE|nr:hypothetical protein B296_00016411 [Ensete ventricosum]
MMASFRYVLPPFVFISLICNGDEPDRDSVQYDATSPGQYRASVHWAPPVDSHVRIWTASCFVLPRRELVLAVRSGRRDTESRRCSCHPTQRTENESRIKELPHTYPSSYPSAPVFVEPTRLPFWWSKRKAWVSRGTRLGAESDGRTLNYPLGLTIVSHTVYEATGNSQQPTTVSPRKRPAVDHVQSPDTDRPSSTEKREPKYMPAISHSFSSPAAYK